MSKSHDQARRLIKTDDGSVIDESGRVLYFSVERFIKDICEGDCCFICGVSPSQAVFNDEHILPQWILRKFDLFGKRIGLPNDSDFRYGSYTIPCCEACNSQMARTFETPLSRLFDLDFNAVNKYLVENGPWLLFYWLNLIFIKTHLKDKSLRLHRDRRKPDDRISDYYTWEDLHHIHCVSRSFYSRAGIAPDVIGSIFVLPAKPNSVFGEFDYSDNYAAKTMLLRLGEIAFVCVLTDSCAVLNVLADLYKRIDGLLSSLQLREFMCHAAFVNLNLEHPPRFTSWFQAGNGRYLIKAEHPPKVQLGEMRRCQFGELLESVCGEIIDVVEPVRKDEIRQWMREGRWVFLFNADEKFDRGSMESMDRETPKD
jgi:hypothetical protein